MFMYMYIPVNFFFVFFQTLVDQPEREEFEGALHVPPPLTSPLVDQVLDNTPQPPKKRAPPNTRSTTGMQRTVAGFCFVVTAASPSLRPTLSTVLELEDLSRPLLESSDESAASSPTEDPPPLRLVGEYDDDHERTRGALPPVCEHQHPGEEPALQPM